MRANDDAVRSALGRSAHEAVARAVNIGGRERRGVGRRVTDLRDLKSREIFSSHDMSHLNKARPPGSALWRHLKGPPLGAH